MSHLPEPGEVRTSAEVLDRRLGVIAGDEATFTAEINTRTGEMRGEGDAIRAAYGDLFDVGELAGLAQAPVTKFLSDIAQGRDPEVVLRSMYMLAVAHGVLMERARWQRAS